MPVSTQKTLNCVSKCLCGTTTNPNEAGYILTDGTMLDFSGKRFGAGAGVREMDHRDPCISKTLDTEEIEWDTPTLWCDFMKKSGAIRFSKYGNEIDIDIIQRPTAAQETKLKQIIARSNRPEVAIDKTNSSCDTIASEYHEMASPTVINKFIEKYFSPED